MGKTRNSSYSLDALYWSASQTHRFFRDRGFNVPGTLISGMLARGELEGIEDNNGPRVKVSSAIAWVARHRPGAEPEAPAPDEEAPAPEPTPEAPSAEEDPAPSRGSTEQGHIDDARDTLRFLFGDRLVLSREIAERDSHPGVKRMIEVYAGQNKAAPAQRLGFWLHSLCAVGLTTSDGAKVVQKLDSGLSRKNKPVWRWGFSKVGPLPEPAPAPAPTPLIEMTPLEWLREVEQLPEFDEAIRKRVLAVFD